MAQKRVSASEMLSGLKSRLGFAHSDDEGDEFSDYESELDEYDDFDDEYADEFDDRVSSRRESSRTSSRFGTTRSTRFGHPESTPNLVSIDDVREHNKSVINSSRGSYESAHRDRTASGYASSGAYVPATGSVSNRYTSTYQRNSLGRDLIEPDGPAVSSPSYNASQRAATRSEGLNSLFQPSSGASSPAANSTETRSLAFGGSRELVIIRPRVYNDVQDVARALKAGNAVVLAMTTTPEDLYKRLLDFSFGVASALDAHVDGIGGKVYALAIGPELSEEEIQQLRVQGVL